MAPGLGLELAGQVEPIRLDARCTDAVSRGREQRVGHRSADRDRVDVGQQVIDQRNLVRDLGSAEDREERPLGRTEHAPEEVDLAREQEAAGSHGELLGESDHRRVRAMRRAERVVDVGVAETSERAGEARLLLRLLLPRVEAQVLQQQHLTWPERARCPLGRGAHAVVDEGDLLAEPLGQALAHRAQAQLGPRHALRTTEVAHQHHRRAVLERMADRRQCRDDPCVVRDAAVLDRHVEVDAQEDALACQIEVRDAQLGHQARTRHSATGGRTPIEITSSRIFTRCS